MAVQCLYQQGYAEAAPAQLIERVRALGNEETAEDEQPHHQEPDEALLGGIVTGALEHAAALEDKLTAAIPDRWNGKRLTPLQRAIVKAAAYELVFHPKLTAATVIDAYVSLSAEFFDPQEVGLLNGILQEVANAVAHRTP